MRLSTRTVIFATMLALAAAPAFAQDNSAASEPAAKAPAAKVEVIPTPEAAKPHDGKLDPEAATNAYLATIKGEARAKSDAYFEGGYVLQVVDVLYALAIAAILLFTRLSARMRRIAERLTRFRWLQVTIYGVQYLILVTAMVFPLNVYENFIREHNYGLSNQDFGGWFGDWIKLFGVGTLFFVAFVTVLYAVMRWTKENWWKWGTVVVLIFLAFSAMIYPVYIAPLVNDYKPLDEGTLRQEILSMARANGVPADNVWQFNASKQSKRISANVSGFLGTTRISLNDNLLNRATTPEIRAVMGHELGHYVLDHVYIFLSWYLIVFFVAFGFTNWAYKKLTARFGARWDVHGIADPAGMPLLFVLLSFLGFIGTPVLNTMTRTIEAHADIFGLNSAREPDGFATVALKLSEYRKLDPSPLEEFVYYDHPSGRSRISMAMHWKAEHLGDTTR